MKRDVVESIMLERNAVCFRTTSPTDPDPVIFLQNGALVPRRDPPGLVSHGLSGDVRCTGSLFAMTTRSPTPVIYTHSGTIRRTQGQSLLSGSHRKNQDEVSTMAGMTLLLIGGGTNLSINTKINQQYTQVFRSGWRSLKPSLGRMPFGRVKLLVIRC